MSRYTTYFSDPQDQLKSSLSANLENWNTHIALNDIF